MAICSQASKGKLADQYVYMFYNEVRRLATEWEFDLEIQVDIPFIVNCIRSVFQRIPLILTLTDDLMTRVHVASWKVYDSFIRFKIDTIPFFFIYTKAHCLGRKKRIILFN